MIDLPQLFQVLKIVLEDFFDNFPEGLVCVFIDEGAGWPGRETDLDVLLHVAADGGDEVGGAGEQNPAVTSLKLQGLMGKE